MTRRWPCPVWTYACRKSREAAKLTAEARALRIDVAILSARVRLANEQRDRARDLVAALLGQSTWTASDVAEMHAIGIDVER
jgi:hypothetical protein